MSHSIKTAHEKEIGTINLKTWEMGGLKKKNALASYNAKGIEFVRNSKFMRQKWKLSSSVRAPAHLRAVRRASIFLTLFYLYYNDAHSILFIFEYATRVLYLCPEWPRVFGEIIDRMVNECVGK